MCAGGTENLLIYNIIILKKLFNFLFLFVNFGFPIFFIFLQPSFFKNTFVSLFCGYATSKLLNKLFEKIYF